MAILYAYEIIGKYDNRKFSPIHILLIGKWIYFIVILPDFEEIRIIYIIWLIKT